MAGLWRFFSVKASRVAGRIAPLLLLLNAANPAVADTLVYNVTGYTMNAGKVVRFAGLEYAKGRVTSLYGQEKDIAASKAGTRIDGQGATLLPGLTDAHGHVGNLGLLLETVQLAGSSSEIEASNRVRSYIEQAPGQDWILGRGWNQVLWPEKE